MAETEEKKKKKIKRTETKRSSQTKNDIRILGSNVLYNNGIITAYYIVPMVNYSTASSAGRESSVQSLVDLIKNLYTNNPELLFTIERIKKTVKKRDVLANLLDTIHMYRPEYTMPIEFTSKVQDDDQEYCLIGIDIQQTSVTNVEDLSLLDTAKELGRGLINAIGGTGNAKMDPEKILDIERNIFNTISGRVVRADQDLVFYTYVSKIYPNFEISYDKLSYINANHYEDIMASVSQSISDNFGFFEMHNEGIDFFGIEPRFTYGCMLDVKAFPLRIDSADFPMDYPDVVTTIQCMKKEQASVQIKRTRSADSYELRQAEEAGAEEESLASLEENIAIATHAIEEIDAGEIMCQFSTSMIIYADTIDELRAHTAKVIAACKDRDILVSKSLTQALDFLNNYINRKPRKFDHLTNIAFPLSFQQNAGATVGDINVVTEKGKPLWSPAIGEDIV